MTATINASTSSGVVITPDNSGTVALQGAGTTGLTVDSSGYVLTPTRPAFRARCSQATFSGTSEIIPFNSVVTNIGGCYSNSTYRFTAPVSGMYQFDAGVYVNQNTSNYGILRIDVNGSPIKYAETQGAALVVSLHIGICTYLNANDYVYAYWQQNGGRQYYQGSQESHFSGFLIG